MKEWTYEYKVGAWALPVLINGDTSGLDPEDEFRMESFMDEVHGLMQDGDYLSWDVVSDQPYFQICDISRLYDNVYDIVLHIRRYESQTEEA